METWRAVIKQRLESVIDSDHQRFSRHVQHRCQRCLQIHQDYQQHRVLEYAGSILDRRKKWTGLTLRQTWSYGGQEGYIDR